MKRFNKAVGVVLLAGLVASAAFAQRPRGVNETAKAEPVAATVPAPAPAPQTVKAKYEGGVFGYEKKRDGTLSFDDTNKRLLFRDKQQRELLFIPYEAVRSAFSDTKSRRPAAATVISHIPSIFALPAAFIKTKVQYLTLQYEDPDTHMSGVTSFKLENRAMVASVLNTLAQKANLTPRGDIYVKRKTADDDDDSTPRSDAIRVSAPGGTSSGSLKSKAISLPPPGYPVEARESRAEGDVVVQITVDEQGNVIDARALSGHPLLQGAAVNAARQAKFSPTVVDGKPVKVTGTLTYNFTLN
ncbi:MAG TPA: TonB family protein [Pyrinomonadaceae bacterium]|jgi:TonB family protein